jgi:hypothetical protein
MFKIPTLTRALVVAGLVVGIAPLAQAQATTDVLVRDGAGNVIASDVHEFDWNTAGSGLAEGFTPVLGSSFTFLYQANLVAFNDVNGQPITPAAGLNVAFGSGGYEYTVAASITETVTGVSVDGAGNTTVTFATTGGTATIFFDNASQGGVKSNTASGNGFDDGTVVGVFDVVAGAGLSNFTTFADGSGLGATKYDFLVNAGGVNSAFIQGNLGPIGDLHFTSSQVLPPGSSVTASFHNNAPNDGNPDIYPTTPATAGLLLKVDGSNTFTTAVPEPETYALMFAGLAAVGFMARRRRSA